jgi:glycosyltransferase involved in cell wall biosynthesis
MMRHEQPLAPPEHMHAHKRVGLVYRSGKPPEKAWSGIPAGLARGLSELGFNAEFIDAEPPWSVTRAAQIWATLIRRSRHGGMLAPEIRELRRLSAKLRVSRRHLDAVVQMGSDFGVPLPGRLVTYEDQTVSQLVRVYPIRDLLDDAAIASWIRAQAKCYDTAVACCVMSRWAADSIVHDYGIDPGKVHVIGAGRNYEPRPIDRDWTRVRFFFMGYDWERKNGSLLLRAFARLKERVRDARLDIAGGHPRIDMEGVTAHGPLEFSDPRQRAHAEGLFESATCFVMPSQCENFGIVYVEAAAAGVPSIGTTVGGAADAIGHEGGLLIDPSNEQALVDAMVAMCDPKRARSMGAAARKRSRLFTWRAVAERIADALGLRLTSCL